jgi:preprotein translocase subunit SecF
MINFFKFWKLYATISSIIITSGVVSIIFFGFNLSIDFIGGTALTYRFENKFNLESDAVNTFLEKLGHKVVSIDVENDSILNIKASAISEQQEIELRNEIRDKLGVNMEILKFETVGPTIGAETLKKTVYAILLAILVIILYIAYAFKNVNYAISAVIALFHDILVVVGSYSIISHIFEAEFDLLFVTAILTTLAFSVHDTIVVFDQMRGYKKSAKFAGLSVEEQANHAVTSTIVRSLNNSLTIIFMLIALVLLGGESIRFFAVALLLGTVTGTYSSPFVSVPIAVFLEKRAKK